jgi:hypothetical protein
MEAAVAALATIVGAAIIIGGFYLWDRWTHSNTRVELGVAAHQRSGAPQVECPNCHTKNAERVKVGSRVASGVVGGLVFSRKARAQFHCLTCSTYW